MIGVAKHNPDIWGWYANSSALIVGVVQRAKKAKSGAGIQPHHLQERILCEAGIRCLILKTLRSDADRTFLFFLKSLFEVHFALKAQ